MAARRRAGGGRAGPAPCTGVGAVPRRGGGARGGPGRSGPRDLHSGLPGGGQVSRPMPIPDLAADHRRQRAEGRRAPPGPPQGRAAGGYATDAGRRPVRTSSGGGGGREGGGGGPPGGPEATRGDS